MTKAEKCAVVQDLLPIDLDGLTSAETHAFVARHLTQCEGCRRVRDAMAAPLSHEEQAHAELLNRLRRQRVTRRRLTWGLIAALLLTALVLLCPLPRTISRTTQVLRWTAGHPEAACSTVMVRMKGVYYDYLLKTDDFHGQIIIEGMPITQSGKDIRVEMNAPGLLGYQTEEGLLHLAGFLVTDSAMEDFIIGVYDEQGGWTGDDGVVLTSGASTREEAVAKTRQLCRDLNYSWLADSVWEGGLECLP